MLSHQNIDTDFTDGLGADFSPDALLSPIPSFRTED